MKEASNKENRPLTGEGLSRRGFVKTVGVFAGTALILNTAAPLVSAAESSGVLGLLDGEGKIVEESGYFDCKRSSVKYFLARPAKGSIFPAIYLVHEVFGMTENVRNHARELAAKGNLVFVPDCLPAVDGERMEDRIEGPEELDKLAAGLAFLAGRPDVDANRISGEGRCWEKSRDASRSSYEVASSGGSSVRFDVRYYQCDFPFDRIGQLA
ncbi:MAG: dienelactone hydrolase family protein [Pyrinomonadaceae bacterium]